MYCLPEQITKEYPGILTPDNIWITGITHSPSTQKYYLVFYYDSHVLLDRFMQLNEHMKYMQYSDFEGIKELGSGGYGTVYIAKYKKYSEVEDVQETVVLKQFKSSDEMSELFITEVNNNNC